MHEDTMLSERARAQDALRFDKLLVSLIVSMALSFAACACTSQGASLTSDRKQCVPGNLVESLSRAVDPFKGRRSNQAGPESRSRIVIQAILNATNRSRVVQRASQGAQSRARSVS